jgi:two-component sensor histidine kinase
MNLYDKCRKWIIGAYVDRNPDIYHQARAELLFNASFLVYLVCIPLVIYTLVNGMHEKTIPTVIGLVFVSIQLALFKKFQNTWWSSLFVCTATTAIVFVNINFNENEIHLVEPFWMIVIVDFALFMMGVKWGIFFCIVLMTGFTFFVVNKLESNLRYALDSITSVKYLLICEIAAAVFTLVYILSMFMRTANRSDRALREVNSNLGSQNQHHRVKNNLQVVNSLLRLQSGQLKDARSRKVFEDAQYRIKAIALIHERMYKSVELSDIDTITYFKGLAKDLLRQNVTNQQIDLQVEVGLIDWNQDIVVPMGLLLNELIANSVEHGGLAENGLITVVLKADEKDVVLDYFDNGGGFADNYTTGFGLELIATLNEQLNGEMILDSAPGKGVMYRFRFREEEY